MRLGNKEVAGVGFGIGLERIIDCLLASGEDALAFVSAPRVVVVSQGEKAFEENLVLTMTLRRRGVHTHMNLEKKSIKAQMRMAGRSNAEYVVIRGEREMEEGTFLLKTMADGTQKEMDMPTLLELLTSPCTRV